MLSGLKVSLDEATLYVQGGEGNATNDHHLYAFGPPPPRTFCTGAASDTSSHE